MKSFQELFCEECQCDVYAFQKKVFWQCLPRHAVPVALLLGGSRAGYFGADLNLIACVGRALTIDQVTDEIDYYFGALDNRRWLSEIAHIRLSTSRLKRLAKHYLRGAESNSPSDFAPAERF